MKNEEPPEWLIEKWGQEQMDERIPLLEEWKVEKIFIGYNKRKYLFHELLHIRFPNLRIINIWGNNIQSIENLCHLQCPLMSELYLCGNFITTMRTLRKCHMPCLKYLDISANFIVDLHVLPSCNTFHCQIFLLQCASDDLYECDNIVWVAKLQSEVFYQFLEIVNEKRIIQTSILNTLRKKWQDIVIADKNNHD